MNLKKTHFNRCFEFQFPDVDTRILVEDLEDGVVIHASRDSFSDQRKACFIRELSAEGFISDDYRWVSDSKLDSLPGVHWEVDSVLVRASEEVPTRTNRLMVRLLIGSVLLWFIMIGGLFLFR